MNGCAGRYKESLAIMSELSKRNGTVTAAFLASRGYSISRAARAVDLSVTHLRLGLQGKRVLSKEKLRELRRLKRYSPVKCLVGY